MTDCLCHMQARVIKSPVVSLNVTVNGGGFPVVLGSGPWCGDSTLLVYRPTLSRRSHFMGTRSTFKCYVEYYHEPNLFTTSSKCYSLKIVTGLCHDEY